MSSGSFVSCTRPVWRAPREILKQVWMQEYDDFLNVLRDPSLVQFTVSFLVSFRKLYKSFHTFFGSFIYDLTASIFDVLWPQNRCAWSEEYETGQVHSGH